MPKEIPLTRGKIAIVDDEDYEWLSQYKWCYQTRGYACRRIHGTGKLISMHKEIMDVPENMEIDHENRNKLDNRRSNLRVSTHTENNYNKSIQSNNTSGYKGVSPHIDGKWRATIRYGGKYRHLGLFSNPTDAAVVYDKEALIHHGEFAYTNFPRENYQ